MSINATRPRTWSSASEIWLSNSEAPQCGRYGAEPALKRAESPTGSVERVLEIERLKSAPGFHGSPSSFPASVQWSSV
jgi:hypothetical protein